jgi:hypothetical protein
MTKPQPNVKALVLAQFAAIDASFRLDGFEATAYSEAITEAIASLELTTEEAVAKVLTDAMQGDLHVAP